MKKLAILFFSIFFIFSCSKKFSVVAEKGKQFPEFTVKSVDGKQTFKSSDILKEGKKTLFVVSAEWCPHCVNQSPDIQRYYDEHKDNVNVVVVYSTKNSSPEAVKEYLERNQYTFPAYYDYDDVIFDGASVEGFPLNVFIGADGKIIDVVNGEIDYSVLEENLGQ